MLRAYRESVWPKFVMRYGWSPPTEDLPLNWKLALQ